MKLATFAILAASLLAGCESSRHGLPCVGIVESDRKVPGVQYEVSTTNVVVGVLFSGSVLVPAIVLLKEFECPMGPAPEKK